ncbi:MAG: histidine ammonia-lyase [Proteobacteria bacterium]|nr:histidine ammonia-lyase [Pseudomonadota bacterium]
MSSDTPFKLGEERLSSTRLAELAATPRPNVVATPTARERLAQYRKGVEDVLSSQERVYGINTGFGFLANVAIEPAKLAQLQVNLVRSHACGVGEPVDDVIVRAMLILRAHTFLIGHSGVSLGTMEQILHFLDHDLLPVVPCQGSVGASGDLAPLAHLALGLMGEGDIRVQGRILPAAEALQSAGLKPLQLEAKEGLSLINGTQFMTAIAAFAVAEARTIAASADIAAAMSLDAIRGTLTAFDPRIHAVRPHPGQSAVAAHVFGLFTADDPIMASHADCSKVQDPYSFRCVPQVHGASRDAIEYAERVVDIELNSVTDNPLVFTGGDVLSGGNFHGQPIAMAMDFLAIAVAELGSIAERRIEKITNPHQSGLPAFATRDSGLNSGFMIPHVVAAALVSESKILCHPASIDSIPTSADQEDHVSMGPIAARKARQVNGNVRNILAIEFLAATQGLDLLLPLKPSGFIAALLDEIRLMAPVMHTDRSLHKEIAAVARWLQANGPMRCVARLRNGIQS